jgi:hypothetical protein
MSNRPVLLALAACLLAVPAAAQNVTTRNLSRPEVEFSEPFTQLAGVRELRDGRVIAIDPRDKIVQVIDLRAGSATRLGRDGAGPGEYGLPLRLLPLPGDTSAVVDLLNNRMLLINPNATVGGFVETPPPSEGRGGGGMIVMASGMPTAVDARGRFYGEGSPITMVNGTPQSSDSVPMLRWSRAAAKRDTVAWRSVPKDAVQVSGGNRGGRANVNVRIGGGGAPFQPADQMTVAPDGRVAIVHAEPYRVDFVSETGQRTTGQPIRYDRVRVSEGHKEEWRESRRSAMGIAISMENGRRSAQMMPMRDVPDPENWGGEYMPPFLANTSAATFSNDGYLWIRRTGPAGQPPTYDVIDRAGNLAAKVVLPQRSRLVGFGNGTVYTVRLDEDDLQYLQRHRFSMPERP